MMGRLLCWVGLHKWQYLKSRVVYDDLTGGDFVDTAYRCARCGDRYATREWNRGD